MHQARSERSILTDIHTVAALLLSKGQCSATVATDIAKVAIENGTSVNCRDKRGWTPLQFAVRGGSKELTQLILEKGGEIDAQNTDRVSALLLACSWCRWFETNENVHIDFDLVKLLLDNGANINSKDLGGKTALFWATKCGHKEVVELLIERGASVHEVSVALIEGRTVLHEACECRDNNSAVVKLLLQNGANMESKDRDGWTPLMFAISLGRMEVIELLIKEGANINEPDKYDHTPLYNAGMWSKFPCAEILLKAGVDTRGTSPWFKPQTVDVTAVDRLPEYASEEHVQLFYNFGVKHSEDCGVVYLNECPSYVKYLCENPRPLLSCCRLTIRHTCVTIGQQKGKTSYQALQVLNELPLPTSLKAYLMYQG